MPADAPLAGECLIEKRFYEGSNRRHDCLPSAMNSSPAAATSRLRSAVASRYQPLTHHPHVHCLVPGGGVAFDGRRWVGCKPNFLFSVHALSRTFRRIFLEGLEAAFRRCELGFFTDLAPLADPGAFAERMGALLNSSFVVYAKPPFGGPERVLAHSLSTACPHLRAPGAPRPRWAHHIAVPFREQPDNEAPLISYRITAGSGRRTASSRMRPSNATSTKLTTSCGPNFARRLKTLAKFVISVSSCGVPVSFSGQ
jgi:Putative transposase